MKRKIRLTESEMVTMIERIVNEIKREKRKEITESLKRKGNRLIKEDNGNDPASKLYNALTGSMIDDKEDVALSAIKSIKNCEELKNCMTKIKKLSGKDLVTFIDDEMSAIDKEYDDIVKHIKNIVKVGSPCSNMLEKQFNDSYGSWNNLLKWVGGRTKSIED